MDNNEIINAVLSYLSIAITNESELLKINNNAIVYSRTFKEVKIYDHDANHLVALIDIFPSSLVILKNNSSSLFLQKDEFISILSSSEIGQKCLAWIYLKGLLD